MRNTPVDSLLLWKLWQTNVPYEDICTELRISKSQLFRLAKQRGMKHRPKPPRSGKQIIDPTPLEIKHRSAAIRANWSPEEENSRRVGWKNRAVSAHRYSYNSRDGVFRMDT